MCVCLNACVILCACAPVSVFIHIYCTEWKTVSSKKNITFSCYSDGPTNSSFKWVIMCTPCIEAVSIGIHYKLGFRATGQALQHYPS